MDLAFYKTQDIADEFERLFTNNLNHEWSGLCNVIDGSSMDEAAILSNAVMHSLEVASNLHR
eukprot:9116983-Pyramimonas_sp.AAC.1